MTRARFSVAALLLAVSCAPAVRTSSAQGAGAAADVKGLPVNFIAPKGNGSHYMALVMTGDGGFASLVSKLSDGLSDAGIGVVGFNSREWLSPAKTADASAAAAERAIRAGMARYHADSVVIVGYSRGADLAPFVTNRLPADLRSVLGGVAMFGLATYANFEFHLIDLVKDSKRDSDVPIMPELLKLKGVPMACVFGSDEKESGCREVPAGLMTVDMREGGHHFDGADKSLAQVVLKLIHASH